MKKIKILHIILIALTILSLTSIAAKDVNRTFRTNLTGAAEVPPADPDGKGTATITINYGQGTLCWQIRVSAITLPATAAHVHQAPAGTNGPVVVPLSAPDANGSASGCATVSRDILKGILEHPEEYYVNVHNSDFPGGAVRGQL